MGAPVRDMKAAENATAEALLSSLQTIAAAERRKHATVFNYWLSIRGNRQFPPIRDLDPLEISDAGPWSVLLEMIGAGEDAVIRHLGQAIKADGEVENICAAPAESLLSCIHGKLPTIAASRQAFAFEDTFETGDGTRRCWVTLLPFSTTGTWVDYVYGFVSLEPAPGEEAEVAELVEDGPPPAEEVAEAAEEAFEPYKVPLRPFDEESEAVAEEAAPVELTQEPVEETVEPGPEPDPAPVDEAVEPSPEPEPEPVEEVIEPVSVDEPEPEPEPEPVEQAFEPASVDEPEAHPDAELASATKPSFSAKLLDSLASVSEFYGKVVQTGPSFPSEIAAQEPTDELTCDVEGTLHSKLSEVRAKAEEARAAQMRSMIALNEGLSAAYDFALDAEHEPEEYLRLVEAQGLKIQLRSPMKPVVKLAFDGVCDEARIEQLEAVLAWALKMDLPRGSLAERIEAEGGIGKILSGLAHAA